MQVNQLIDNNEKMMVDALKEALKTSDRVDINVGYFYFSGFQLLSEELKNKKIRILVGLELDPKRISQIIYQ